MQLRMRTGRRGITLSRVRRKLKVGRPRQRCPCASRTADEASAAPMNLQFHKSTRVGEDASSAPSEASGRATGDSVQERAVESGLQRPQEQGSPQVESRETSSTLPMRFAHRGRGVRGSNESVVSQIGSCRGGRLVRPASEASGRATGDSVQERTVESRLPRFQYKYAGTPISTMNMLQKLSAGRFHVVFASQATPIST
jgi:hypothetical protein